MEEIEKIDKKGRNTNWLIISIIILLLLIGGIAIYKNVNSFDSKKAKFEKAYENLQTECTINSCSSTEYETKLEEIKEQSGLTEEEMNTIISEELK